MVVRLCKNCDHYDQVSSLCRAKPPVFVLFPNPHDQTLYEPQSVWPEVKASDWCGEFKNEQE